MAYNDITTVTNSTPIYTTNDPSGLLNKKTYGLRYDPTTGSYRVQEFAIATGFLGGKTIRWGNDVLYEDGTWFKIATQDSNLFDQTTKNETLTFSFKIF